MYKKLLILCVLFCAAVNAQQLNNPQQTLNQTNKSFFIQNKGQWDPEVKYLASIGGMNAWITNSGVVYDYYRITKNIDETKILKMNLRQKRDYESKNTSIQGHVVKMQLVNTENNITGTGNNRKEGYYNYFIGNDQSKWASNVPLYDNVELQGVYKNIDIKYYYDNGMLRYDYKAKPGADISQLKFKFDGQEGIRINEKGELILKTSLGEVTNGKIYAYQTDGGTQKEVECKFEQRQDGTIGLKAEIYDSTKELIIDPLVYSTYIGGNNYDSGNSIAIDSSGNAYITGWTESSNFPTTSGAYQITMGSMLSNQNVFVTKLNSTGSSLIYSTYIGGNYYNSGNSIAIDSSGNAYITGWTEASNFPTTSGAYQITLAGAQNAFITKLNSTGSALVYSTFIGGSGTDQGNSIAIDSSGNAYITGEAYSDLSNFPVTSGAFQTSLKGNMNAFVTKLNSNGSALVYSTLIGGSGVRGDQGNSITIDGKGNVYITGYTYSSNYPTTSGAFQTTFSGNPSESNVFITKINSSGSALVYSTFIGSGVGAYGTSIAIDANENAYITGWAEGYYPITSGAYQDTTLFGGGVFITKINSTGSALVYSSLIGDAFGNSIVTDVSGNTYITGYASSDYPTTSDAYQITLGGEQNAFITKLNSTGSALVYSTFIGGSGEFGDQGNSIAIDANGNAYITGEIASYNYPTTTGAFQTTLGGFQNAFITKLNILNPTFVVSNSSNVPNKFELMQNFPNPFNPTTVISFALPFSSNVKIEAYNILGERVRELLNAQKTMKYILMRQD
jgi:roadblock/LC7 domain-containing protein